MQLGLILNWIWTPVLITIAAILGIAFEWPVELTIPILGFLLLIGIISAVVNARERETVKLTERLRHLSSYFNRRFMGTSSISIFMIINSLFKTENTKLWDWAHSCDTAQRVFNTWSEAFIERLVVDSKTGRFGIYLRTYISELWMMNNLYYEFIEQFHEIAEKVEMPRETIEQYNRFVLEYNGFADNFRTFISDSLRSGKTDVETPSVKPATESIGGSVATTAEQSNPPLKPPPSPLNPPNNRGYYA